MKIQWELHFLERHFLGQNTHKKNWNSNYIAIHNKKTVLDLIPDLGKCLNQETHEIRILVLQDRVVVWKLPTNRYDKIQFFRQTWFEQNLFYPKKWVNYNKSNLRHNTVKVQKNQNIFLKMPKSTIKFQNVQQKSYQKAQICNMTHFLDKILQRFYPR